MLHFSTCSRTIPAAAALLCIAAAATRPTDRVQVTPSVSYTLDDAVERAAEFPETFHIPKADARNELQPGQLVKLMFNLTAEGKTWVERMWVVVDRQDPDSGAFIATLDNDAYRTDAVRQGLVVRFEPRHVIDIFEKMPTTLPATTQPTPIPSRSNRHYG